MGALSYRLYNHVQPMMMLLLGYGVDAVLLADDATLPQLWLHDLVDTCNCYCHEYISR